MHVYKRLSVLIGCSISEAFFHTASNVGWAKLCGGLVGCSHSPLSGDTYIKQGVMSHGACVIPFALFRLLYMNNKVGQRVG